MYGCNDDDSAQFSIFFATRVKIIIVVSKDYVENDCQKESTDKKSN